MMRVGAWPWGGKKAREEAEKRREEEAEKRRKEKNKKQADLAQKSFQATSMYPMVETHADENEELITAVMKELGESLEMLGGKDEEEEVEQEEQEEDEDDEDGKVEVEDASKKAAKKAAKTGALWRFETGASNTADDEKEQEAKRLRNYLLLLELSVQKKPQKVTLEDLKHPLVSTYKPGTNAKIGPVPGALLVDAAADATSYLAQTVASMYNHFASAPADNPYNNRLAFQEDTFNQLQARGMPSYSDFMTTTPFAEPTNPGEIARAQDLEDRANAINTVMMTIQTMYAYNDEELKTLADILRNDPAYRRDIDPERALEIFRKNVIAKTYPDAQALQERILDDDGPPDLIRDDEAEMDYEDEEEDEDEGDGEEEEVEQEEQQEEDEDDEDGKVEVEEEDEEEEVEQEEQEEDEEDEVKVEEQESQADGQAEEETRQRELQIEREARVEKYWKWVQQQPPSEQANLRVMGDEFGYKISTAETFLRERQAQAEREARVEKYYEWVGKQPLSEQPILLEMGPELGYKIPSVEADGDLTVPASNLGNPDFIRTILENDISLTHSPMLENIEYLAVEFKNGSKCYPLTNKNIEDRIGREGYELLKSTFEPLMKKIRQDPLALAAYTELYGSNISRAAPGAEYSLSKNIYDGVRVLAFVDERKADAQDFVDNATLKDIVDTVVDSDLDFTSSENNFTRLNFSEFYNMYRNQTSAQNDTNTTDNDDGDGDDQNQDNDDGDGDGDEQNQDNDGDGFAGDTEGPEPPPDNDNGDGDEGDTEGPDPPPRNDNGDGNPPPRGSEGGGMSITGVLSSLANLKNIFGLTSSIVKVIRKTERAIVKGGKNFIDTITLRKQLRDAGASDGQVERILVGLKDYSPGGYERRSNYEFADVHFAARSIGAFSDDDWANILGH